MSTPTTIQGALQEFVSNTTVLKDRFRSPVPNVAPFSASCPPVHGDSKSFLVIILQNAWSSFCKALLELSVQGKGPTLGGTALTAITVPPEFPSIQSLFRKTATLVANDMPSPGDYPIWHNPEYVIRVADKLKPGNHSKIVVGLGASGEAKNVNVVRNYIVHGNETDYGRFVSKLGVRGLPVSEVLAYSVNGAKSVFENWIDDLVSAATNASN